MIWLLMKKEKNQHGSLVANPDHVIAEIGTDNSWVYLQFKNII